MMNLLTGVNGQLPVLNKRSASKGRLPDQKEKSAINGQQAANEKDGEDKELRNIAKEMESLFAYQLLKTMRESTDNMSDEKKGNGYNTYMSMFDMEISKLFGEKGLGMQDAIIRSLERMPGVKNDDNNNSSSNLIKKND